LTGTSVLKIAYLARTPEGDLKFVLLAFPDLQKFVQDRAAQSVEILIASVDGTVLAWSPQETRGNRKSTSIKNCPSSDNLRQIGSI